MAHRRFELAQKFWQIERISTSHKIKFGKIGSPGQTKVKDFPSLAATTVAIERAIAQKLKEGYVEIGAPAKRSTAPKIVTPAAKPARLAAAIARCKAWMIENGAAVLVKNLSKPATDAALVKAAKQLGFALPAELVALWKIHDGQKKELNGFIGSLDLLGTRDAPMIQSDVLGFCEWMIEDPKMVAEAGLTAEEENREWVPFGTRDSDHVVVHARTGRVFTLGKMRRRSRSPLPA